MTDGFRSLKIDHQLKRGGLLDRKIGRLGATQYLDNHPRSLTKDFSQTRTVTRKAALVRVVRPLVDCRQAQCGDPVNNHTNVGGGNTAPARTLSPSAPAALALSIASAI